MISEKLSEDDLIQVIRNAPLVAIDIICRDSEGRVLLLLRKQEPAKNYYFVPGGRILKNETIGQAFERILFSETGFKASFDKARLIGVFDHIYPTNRFEIEGLNTHYVVLAHEIEVGNLDSVKFDPYHANYKWMDTKEILSRKDIHENVKTYFERVVPLDNEFLVGAATVYDSLMKHYTHYDNQLWSRTQLLIAVQGAAFLGSWQIKESFLAIVLLGCGLTT